MFDAITMRIQYHDMDIASLLLGLDQVVVQLLEVRRTGIDDDQFVANGRRRLLNSRLSDERLILVIADNVFLYDGNAGIGSNSQRVRRQ